MSPKGSRKTRFSLPSMPNADCPCHSTRMLFLQFRDLAAGGGRGRLLGVVVLAAPEQGGRGGDETGDDREAEGGVEAVLGRPRDQVGGEFAAGDDRIALRREPLQRFGPDQR